jgi:hypothetical protein
MGGVCSTHGRGEKFLRSFIGKLEGTRTHAILPVDGSKCILRECGVRMWIGFMWLMVGVL